MAQDGDLAAELAAAVSARALTAVFQPQVSLATDRVVAAEALCRWVHPTRGLVAPDVFIPIAERTGTIHEIGWFMIEESAAVARSWGAQGASLEVSVNVSPAQLTASFCAQLTERWDDLRRSIPALTLELTERLPLAEPQADLARLEALREAGIGISLDDFGTGHASLAQLDWLPVSEVKIDRSLLQDTTGACESEIAELVRYAHERGLTVVAEGIETPEQLALARRTGCDRVQGYLLARPMPPADVAVMLAA